MKGILVSVEADVSSGLPGVAMVGSLSPAVKEAQDRVRTALKNSGFQLLAKKITVNLSPANIRKDGTGYDVAIALAILCGYGVIDGEALSDTVFVGELGLDGEIKPVNGVMPIVECAADSGFRRCFLPAANVKEGTAIRGIRIAGVSTLRELVVSGWNQGAGILRVGGGSLGGGDLSGGFQGSERTASLKARHGGGGGRHA